jgi:NADH-quinone oxidoreductase subunit L
MLKWIVFAPLIGAIINGLFGRLFLARLGQRATEKLVGFIACASVGVSAALAFRVFLDLLNLPEGQRRIPEHLFTWLKVGSFQADFAYLLDPLSGVYILFITGVGLLIHIYAAGYMHGDPGYYRFFCYLNLFMFMMLTLVLADNLLLLFVGWEGVGLCSYLLIGYYIKWDVAGSAAKKAFVMNRIGDFGFMIATFLVFTTFGTISFVTKTINGQEVQSFLAQAASSPAVAAGTFTAIALLFFVGATGKSAQIPLFTWLPDAMAGPTPVSALIHAATMVTAGVYLVARCSPVYLKSPTAMAVVAVIGAATAIFAATIGIAQNDIKKVLAYSTVSQLGYMFLACGVGAFVAGIFHVMTHAFFKALLFLGSGSVIHGMNNEQDMRRMGGLKKYMQITYSTMFVGWLAISGFPLMSGFFSKDEILWRTWSTGALPHNWGKALWVVGAITAVITAVYMTRLMVMTFWGRERFTDARDDHHAGAGHASGGHGGAHGHHGRPHESGWLMTVPLIILAILSVFGGYVGVPAALSMGRPNYFERFLKESVSQLEPATATHAAAPPAAVMAQSEPQGATPAPESHGAGATSGATSGATAQTTHEGGHDIGTERLFTAISSVLALLGLAFGLVFFKRNPLWRAPKLLEDKYRVDEFYDATVVAPVENLSRDGLWKVVDVKIIDGLVNGVARLFAALAGALRYTQTGFARNYAAVILLGAIIVIGYFIVSIFGIRINI